MRNLQRRHTDNTGELIKPKTKPSYLKNVRPPIDSRQTVRQPNQGQLLAPVSTFDSNYRDTRDFNLLIDFLEENIQTEMELSQNSDIPIIDPRIEKILVDLNFDDIASITQYISNDARLINFQIPKFSKSRPPLDTNQTFDKYLKILSDLIEYPILLNMCLGRMFSNLIYSAWKHEERCIKFIEFMYSVHHLIIYSTISEVCSTFIGHVLASGVGYNDKFRNILPAFICGTLSDVTDYNDEKVGRACVLGLKISNRLIDMINQRDIKFCEVTLQCIMKIYIQCDTVSGYLNNSVCIKFTEMFMNLIIRLNKLPNYEQSQIYWAIITASLGYILPVVNIDKVLTISTILKSNLDRMSSSTYDGNKDNEEKKRSRTEFTFIDLDDNSAAMFLESMYSWQKHLKTLSPRGNEEENESIQKTLNNVDKMILDLEDLIKS